MERAFTLATIAGIPVKIHWTFGFLIFGIWWIQMQESLSITGVMFLTIYVLILFGCVVMHEYGHALTARRYGIATRDIILSPIGGLARLEELPEQPWQEFKVAFAGPMVNIIIAAILGIFLLITGHPLFPNFDSIEVLYNKIGLVQLVLFMNLILFVFNLIPAFPMDGGRILRALLSLRMPRIRATFVAMVIARVLAVPIFIFGLMNSQIILSLIAVFVFFSSASEYGQIKFKDQLKKSTAVDIMVSDFTIVDADSTYADVLQLSDQTGRQNFLIKDNSGQLMGCIPYPYLHDARKESTDLKLSERYDHRYALVEKSITLIDLYTKMDKEHLSIVGVREESEIVGIIDRSILQDYMKRLRARK